MKRKISKILMMLVLVIVLGSLYSTQIQAGNVAVSDFNGLMTALSYAQDGDIIEFSGYIEIPVQTDLGYSDKQITLKRMNEGSRIEFAYDAGGSSIQNIIFDGNKVLGSSSVIDSANGITITNTTFKDCINANASGGCVVVWDSTASFDQCIFEGCGAFDGAAVRVNNGSSIMFNKCSFLNNIATDKGAVIRVGSSAPSVSFTDCVMRNNKADIGGAIYASCPVTLKNCIMCDNAATSGGADVYIDEYGTLTVNNTKDELKALYEAVSLSYNGVYEDGEEESIDIPVSIAGAKGIAFKSTAIKEEPSPSPVSDEGNNAGGSSSSYGGDAANNTYNQTYSPTINNNITTPTKQSDIKEEPVQATATISDGTGKVGTYEPSNTPDGNKTLEIKEGENTITININVGMDEIEKTINREPEPTYEIEKSEPGSSTSTDRETVYIQKEINWIDVIQIVLLVLIVIYLIRDKVIKDIYRRGKQE